MTEARTNRIYSIVIVLSVIIVYAQSLSFDFVTYDDYELVYQNGEFLSNPSSLGSAFTTHAFTNHRAASAYYRPILLASFILDYQWWRLNAIGYHLTNVLLHAAVVLIVFRLLKSLLGHRLHALFGASLVAFHPVQVEAVAWVAGRNDVLLGFFVVLMVFFHARSAKEPPSRTDRMLSALAFALALFTKESAAFYLLLLPLYDWCVRGVPARDVSTGEWRSRYIFFGVVFLGYAIVRVKALGALIGAEELYGATPLVQRLMNVPATIAEHVTLLLAPIRLSIVHPIEEVFWFGLPWSFVAVLVVVALAGLIRWAWQRDRMLCFGLLWVVVGLLPATNVIPLAVPILEHRLYVPMIGFGIVVARTMSLLADHLRLMWFATSARWAVVGGCVVASMVRLPVWQNSETLWTDAIATEPTASVAYFNLAGYFFEHQRYDRTAEMLEQYVVLEPDDFIGYSKLRQTYFLARRYDDAARVCRLLIERSPNIPSRYVETATLYTRMGMMDSAVAICESGLAVDSTFWEIHDFLGALYAAANRLDDSEAEYLLALHSNPQSSSSHFGMGKLYAIRGEYDMAVRAFEEGLRYGEPPADVLFLLRNAYRKTDQPAKERDLIERYRLQ